MPQFAIIELPDGLTVIELEPDQSAEDAAIGQGGTLVDRGPFSSYAEAEDALFNLQPDEGDA